MKSLDHKIELLVSLTNLGRVLESLGAFSDQFFLGLFNLCPEFGFVLVIDEAQRGELDMFVGWMDTVGAEGLCADLDQSEVGLDEVIEIILNLKEAGVEVSLEGAELAVACRMGVVVAVVEVGQRGECGDADDGGYGDDDGSPRGPADFKHGFLSAVQVGEREGKGGDKKR